MFKLLSDLSLVQRMELPIKLDVPNNEVYTSGYSGSWVTLDSNGKAVLTTTDEGLAWPVWNESNRDGSQGWTKDVKNASSVSVFVGKVMAITDRYTGSPTLGQPLKTDALGKLAVATLGTDHIVAYCKKAPYSYTPVGGTATNVIEIVTVG